MRGDGLRRGRALRAAESFLNDLGARERSQDEGIGVIAYRQNALAVRHELRLKPGLVFLPHKDRLEPALGRADASP
jgi:hypothetical protein